MVDFRPEDVVAGTTISFNPDCWEEEPDDMWTAHRVMDIKVEDGVYYYWPKGDANDEPDGCWIPHFNVDGYIIEIQKGVVPENVDLRDRVNAASAALDAAEDAYRDQLERHCGTHHPPTTCYISQPYYDEVIELYDRYSEAYDSWDCWYKNAKDSEYPSHIPHDC